MQLLQPVQRCKHLSNLSGFGTRRRRRGTFYRLLQFITDAPESIEIISHSSGREI